jgi:glycosyltransferase involved in cell wall biosynthesis
MRLWAYTKKRLPVNWSESMKIVQVNKTYAPHIGGVETTVTTMAEGLCRKPGISVEVLVCNPQRSVRVQHSVVNGVSVTYAPRWGTLASLPASPTYMMHLSRMSGDILHVHEPFPWVDLAATLFPRIRRQFRRIVVTWHGDVVRQRWALSVYKPLLGRFFPLVDRILVSSPVLAENSEFLEPYRDKCEVLPLGVDLDWTRNRSRRAEQVELIKRQHAAPIVLFVGRLVYYKGIQFLVEAMAGVPGAHLIIIGSGPLRAQIEQQITALALNDRVTIMHHLDAEDLHAYYEACDLFVLPSTERSEAYGLVQVEAMASQKPVISTEIHTGTTFVNLDGVSGVVVPPRDACALAGAVRGLLANEGLRGQLGRRGEERALREFSASRMVDRLVDVYERLLSQDAGKGGR